MKMTKKTAPRTTCLLSVDAAAERLSLSPWTIRRWALNGRIASVKLSNRLMIPDYVVADLIAKNLRPADAPDSMQLG